MRWFGASGARRSTQAGLTVVEIIKARRAAAITGMLGVEGENPAMSDPDLDHARGALAARTPRRAGHLSPPRPPGWPTWCCRRSPVARVYEELRSVMEPLAGVPWRRLCARTRW